ncbi:MAG: D-alanyl-D-alanine carboxypeptidase/D-alanyl-D-alanine-endopeptidase [Planctomycetota bacterium]|nr:D-alanyl-D-alanine carboxypeptidase/D-alanyl-D-alanine-endopeptidase [Planctomycetota bacterium]
MRTGSATLRLLFSVALLALSATAIAAADIGSDVRAALRATGLKKADFAVSIRDLRTGKLVASIDGTTPMAPASNQKIVTTGAALLALGADFRFETKLLRDGNRLTVVGSGDPCFGDDSILSRVMVTHPDGTRSKGLTHEALVDFWVTAVTKSAMTAVDELVVDDRILSREGAHPGWPADQLTAEYCAFPCGVNFNNNVLQVIPQVNGGSVSVRTIPSSPWMDIQIKATHKRGKSDKNSAWVRRANDGDTFTLMGNARESYTAPIPACLHDPALYFGEYLASRLRAKGITVARVRTATAADGTPRGTSIAPILRSPIEDAVTRANTDSSNLHAESLLKQVGVRSHGAPGNWSKGCDAVAEMLAKEMGSDASGFLIVDGSGLARTNRVTADGMTMWITRLANDPAVGAIFRRSLAVAGTSGTVKSRMRNIDRADAVVLCKTGYIHGVSCLSGLVESPDGRAYAFSVLGNDLTETGAVGKAKALQDAVATLLAKSLESSKARLGG